MLGKCLIYFPLSVLSSTTHIATWPIRITWRGMAYVPHSLINLIDRTYPVVTFTLLAVGCGVVMGGCAGFAIEVFTSMMVSATWGDKHKTTTTTTTSSQDQTFQEVDPHSDDDEDCQEPLLSYIQQKHPESINENSPSHNMDFIGLRRRSPPVKA